MRTRGHENPVFRCFPREGGSSSRTRLTSTSEHSKAIFTGYTSVACGPFRDADRATKQNHDGSGRGGGGWSHLTAARLFRLPRRRLSQASRIPALPPLVYPHCIVVVSSTKCVEGLRVTTWVKQKRLYESYPLKIKVSCCTCENELLSTGYTEYCED